MVQICHLPHDEIAVRSRYNSYWVQAARELGGKWDNAEKIWVFPEEQLELVVQKTEEIYRYPSAEFVSLKITAKTSVQSDNCMPLHFYGFPLMKCFYNTNAPSVTAGVKKLSGEAAILKNGSGIVITIEEGAQFLIPKMPTTWTTVTSEEWLIEEEGPRLSAEDSVRQSLKFAEEWVKTLKELLQFYYYPECEEPGSELDLARSSLSLGWGGRNHEGAGFGPAAGHG